MPELIRAFETRVDEFVAECRGVKQRDAEWYTLVGRTIGGSDFGALLGESKYGGFWDVVEAKARKIRGDGCEVVISNLAVHWGTLFEDIAAVAAASELGLGSHVRGDDICVQAVPYHRNSPDGFLAGVFFHDNKTLGVATVSQPAPEGTTTLPLMALIEIKSPYFRRPNARHPLPQQYRAQIQSGLAVSPPAHVGLFVDAFFRRCALVDLGPSGLYNRDDHHYDSATWAADGPIAWGVVAFYGTVPVARPLDLGVAPVSVFTAVLARAIEHRELAIERFAPFFADGRGSPPPSLAGMAAVAPPGTVLTAFLPWKLFSLTFMPELREPQFLEKASGLMRDAIVYAEAAAASGEDISAFLGRIRREKDA